MSSQSSDSEGGHQAFDRLHPKIQAWIWQRQWTELRSAQVKAVDPILTGDEDCIISAATAAGKTEAAFLPILSRILETRDGDNGTEQRPKTGVDVLYISPLKALINDQYQRLEFMCEGLDIPVHRWHGDVSATRKSRVLDHPGGVLLITPESLEALFVNQGTAVARVMGQLAYVVVDELHSFIGVERGAQLQSLLNRVELVTRRRVPHIALSATLGDMRLAADFLRPGDGEQVSIVDGGDEGNEIRLQLRGYKSTPPDLDALAADRERQDSGVSDGAVDDSSTKSIASHLFSHLRGSDNLVFANSRSQVEEYADLLTELSKRARTVNEFIPHHGSLSRELREFAEDRLRSQQPITVICTSTLELGIDIGDVASVAQIGPPPSVASLRQRLGRSGRRDAASVLRCYVSEVEVTEKTPPADALRSGLVQTIAMVELLLEGWIEAPRVDDLHLSTLVQQLLSLIAQCGGVSASQAHGALCGYGPFRNVSAAMFVELLRAIGAADLIVQEVDGLLLLGGVGERIVNHYSFFAAFKTPDEYRLVAEGRQLGSIPITRPLVIGQLLIFAGKRWQVLGIDVEHKVIDLARAKAARVPKFAGDGGHIDDVVRRRMHEIYLRDDLPAFLDRGAIDLLTEGRENFERLGLQDTSVIIGPKSVMLLPWRNDRAVATATIALATNGLAASNDGLAITVNVDDPRTLAQALSTLVAQGNLDVLTLASSVPEKAFEKYDRFLSEPLLAAAFASRTLDGEGGWQLLSGVADDLERALRD